MFNYEDLKNLVRQVLKEHRSSLNEGGNVFKSSEGGSATIRIKRDDVDPTLEWLEGILGIDLVNRKLGTTGKKETSGDLDIAIDENAVTKEELTNK